MTALGRRDLGHRRPRYRIGRGVLGLWVSLVACGAMAQTVNSDVDYALTPVEQNLILNPGSVAHAGVGNDLDNQITGNEQPNGLLGHGGDDDLLGGTESDTLVGGLGADFLDGQDGDDRLIGNDGDDHLIGGPGDDLLHGETPTTFSGILTAVHSAGNIEAWMANPGRSHMEAYVRFAPDTPDDVFFGIDQEFLEGGLQPIRYVGADWMAMAAVNRLGALSVRYGSPEEIAGTPATVSLWQSFDLGVQLQPDTWYKFELIADFGILKYESFRVSGPGIDVTQDLSTLNVSFTEFLPSDVPAMTFFLWAARLPSGPVHSSGLPLVEFDDVRTGFEYQGAWEYQPTSSFENQTTIPNQPNSLLGFEVSKYIEGTWYLERIGAAAWIDQVPNAHSGGAVADVVGLGEFAQPSVSDIDLLEGGPGEDNLLGGPGDDTLLGGADDDSLDGGPGADQMEGGPGNDTFQGRDGADTMVGGPGDDLFVVLEAVDNVVEVANEGDDRIISWIDLTLPDHFEKLLIHEDAGPINATGNAVDNYIAGNDAANTLTGLLGNDGLDGQGGVDRLEGGPGADTLDGGTGADVMAGGPGDDVFFLDDTGDSIEELPNEGTDTAFSVVHYTLEPNVENFSAFFGGGHVNGVGNSLDNQMLGNEFPNRLEGMGGNDILFGHFGIDTMLGGTGDDLYFVDDEDDVVIEVQNEGTDRVIALASHQLTPHVESLILEFGAGPIGGTGNDLDNFIQGNEFSNVILGLDGLDTLDGQDAPDLLIGGLGNDILDGGKAGDSMHGGPGNDTYLVDDLGDSVTEAVGEGSDLILSSVTMTLPANVEAMTLTAGATGTVNSTGNALDNVLEGNDDDNVLSGGAGADTISGGDGADEIDGGAGADLLTGNAGFLAPSDQKTDVFKYSVPDQDDTIVGFDTSPPSSGGDVIDLTVLKATLTTPELVLDTTSSPGNTYLSIVDGASVELGLVILGVGDASLLADNVLF